MKILIQGAYFATAELGHQGAQGTGNTTNPTSLNHQGETDGSGGMAQDDAAGGELPMPPPSGSRRAARQTHSLAAGASLAAQRVSL